MIFFMMGCKIKTEVNITSVFQILFLKLK